MQQSDFAFANDIRAAVELRTPRTARLLLISSLAMLFTFIVWAHFAVLDEVKRGAGKVVPSRQMQVVQSLEGGIVGTILVQEGDIVQQGQPLMRIEDTKFASEFGEITERRGALSARVARLEAEAQGRDKLVFPMSLYKTATSAIDNEKAFSKRMRESWRKTSISSLNKRRGSPKT